MNLIKKIVLMSMLTLNIVSITAQAGEFSEGFEDIDLLTKSGWTFDNQSDIVGTETWLQGVPAVFPAHAGSDDSYINGNRNQTAGNIICSWIILPDLGFVEQLNFHTRTTANNYYTRNDRLMVLYSASGGTETGPCVINDVSKNSDIDKTDAGVGNITADFGDFEPLLTINPDLVADVYPTEWTEFNVPVNGDGRLALVYFVDNVRQAPFNGSSIAIDSINIQSGIPPVNSGEATPVPGLSVFGILVLFLLMITLMKKRIRAFSR